MRRKPWMIVVVAGAALLASCLPPAPASPPPPTWPGVGAITQYTGSDCPPVTVVGDSIAVPVGPRLQSHLQSTGRCATVETRAVNGVTVTGWLADRWQNDLDAMPDGSVVVIQFLGNNGGGTGEFAGPMWTDPNWLALWQEAAVDMTVAALDDGHHVYWVVPALSRFLCDVNFIGTQRWQEWAAWVQAELTDAVVTERPALAANFHVADWRSPFGGEAYSAAFTFPDGSARTLRTWDCFHLTEQGSDVAADATVSAIQNEWV